MARQLTIKIGGETLHLTMAEARDLFFILLSFILSNVKEQAED